MEIWKIKAALISKIIRHYNSYTGQLVGFKVGCVSEVADAFCCEPIEGTCKIFISKEKVEELINEKYIRRDFEEGGFTYKEEWAIE